MRHCIKTILVLSVMVVGLQFSVESNARTIKPLTAAQCADLRQNLDAYIKLVTKVFGNGPVVKALIKVAQADVDKLCPQAPPVDDGNHYSPDSPYECKVIDPTQTLIFSLGVDSNGGLVSTGDGVKTICATQNGCQNIVAQKYVLTSTSGSTRCDDPNDATVIHLTDSELQSKIDALP